MAERTPSSIAATPVLTARGVSKTFSGRTVLRDVDFEVRPGEVHGLLGQNGSGKSTFIKVLAGYHAPDPGATLEVNGVPVDLPLGPTDPGRLGMAFVHQDLGLVDSATVVENLRIGRYETRAGWRVPWREERRAAAAALRRFGLHVDPHLQVGRLRDVERALLAIVRALDRLSHGDCGLLVLDEPTAYLPRDGVDRLFAAVREIAASGFGVLFISHRLDEVLAITDRVSVLRDGALVAVSETARLSEGELIEQIVGFSLDELYPEHRAGARPDSVASVRHLSGAHVRDMSFDLGRGEVLGLTGLVGMGQEEVPYLLFGAERASTGRMTVDGTTVEVAGLRPRAAIDLGLALLPADRRRAGAVGAATLAENVSVASISRFFVSGLLRRRREEARVREVLDQFQVVPPQPSRPLATLSGGNQQKALVGKWFETGPRIFLLHEPTQGVDVRARRQIFTHLRRAADHGTGFLLVSSEYEDLAHLCDRVMVFRDGRVVATLAGADLTEERIVEQCFREDRPSHAGAVHAPEQ